MSKTENAFQSLWTKKGGSLNKQDRQKQILLQILASLNQYGQVYTSLYQFRQVRYNSNNTVNKDLLIRLTTLMFVQCLLKIVQEMSYNIENDGLSFLFNLRFKITKIWQAKKNSYT